MRKNIARKLAAFMALVVLLTTFGSDYNSIGARANSDVDAIEQGLSDENGLWEPQGAEQQNVQEAEEPAPEVVEEPQVEEPQVEEPQVEEPPAEEPVQEEPQVEEPQAEAPAEEAQVEEPAENVENPDAQPTEEVQPTEIPEEETPAADTPAEETPSAETPTEDNGEAVMPEEAPAEAGEAEAPAAETPQGIVISYVAAEGGKVSVETETVTEAAAGSTAIADEGYKFANWTDAAATVVGEEATFVPSAEQTVEGAVFTANFEKLAVEAEPEVDMPAVTFDDEAGDISVHVEAGEGAFPEGTIMKVTAVYDQAILDTAAQAAGVEAESTAAVDITFYYKDKDIEPEKPIKVQLHSKVITESDEAQVVHISDDGDANVVSDASINGDTAEFSSSDFSIYVVVGNTDDYRLLVHFNNGDDEIASMYVKKDDDMEQVLYDPGAGDVPDGAIFKGWTQTKEYKKDTTALTISDVRTEVAGMLPPANDGDEVTYYAMLFKQHMVTYYDNGGTALGQDKLEYPEYATGDALNCDYVVNMGYSPEDDEHDFQGWFATKGAENIVKKGEADYTPQDKDVFDNGTAIVIKGDVGFSVNSPEGHWLVFNENGKGATYCAPQFVKKFTPSYEGEVPTDEYITHEPRPATEMTRYGYNFGGWYYGTVGSDGSITFGEAFEFGKTLSENTTIYAKWTAKDKAPYTVILWTQNLERSGYDLKEAYIENEGTVGENIPYQIVDNTDEDYVRIGNRKNVEKHYKGFCAKEPEKEVKITPEGDAVLNIYFDRIEYNLKFYYYRTPGTNGDRYSYANNSAAGQNTWGIATWHNDNRNHPEQTYTTNPEYMGSDTIGGYTGYYFILHAYYGEDISAKWPTYDQIQGTSNDRQPVSFIMMNGTELKPNPSAGGDGTIKGKISILDEKILGATNDSNGNFLIIRFNSYYNWNYHIWYELVDGVDITGKNTHEYNGKTYYEAEVVTPRSSNTDVGQQNAPQYTGYQYIGRRNEDWTNDSRWVRDNVYHINYVYDRIKYKVEFMDGKYVDGFDDNGSGGNLIYSHDANLLHESDPIGQEAKLPADLKDYTPDLPQGEAGFVFAGWYTDATCNTPYSFDNATMKVGGIRVYAKWRQTQYRVFLHGNMEGADWGEGQAMDFRVEYGGKVSSPTGVKDGYVFVGWYTDEECTPSHVFNKDAYVLNDSTVTTPYPDSEKAGTSDASRFWITKRFDLYAKWRKVIDSEEGIHVLYDFYDPVNKVGSGTRADQKNYVDNADAIAFPAPTTPAKFQFDCWVLQTWDGEKYVDTQETVLPGDVFKVNEEKAKKEPDGTNSEGKQLYKYTVGLRAKYKPIGEATPTFIPWFVNDGTAAFHVDTIEVPANYSDSTLKINDAVAIQAPPTRTGYVFKGWARVDMGGNKEAADAFMTGSSNWTQSTTDLFIKYEDGGFTYEGKSATEVAADEAMPYQAMFAVWEDKLTYKANNNSSDADTVVPGEVGEALTVIECPYSYNGYTFKEWNTKADGSGDSYKPNSSTYTLTDADDVLYAIWEDMLTYDANGGTGSMDPTYGALGGKVEVAENGFEYGSYEFLEWNTKADGSGTSYAPGEEYTLTEADDVVYAIWKDELKYDANGGTGSMNPTEGKLGGSVTIATHTFTKDGYDFAGWNTVANPTESEPGVQYEDGDPYTLTDGEDIVYAMWVAKDDELVYNANGGEGSMDPSKGKVDSEVEVKANGFRKDGYTFAGWNTVAKPTEEEPGTEYAAGDSYKLTPEDDILYAMWTPDDDKLSYDANGGTGTMADTPGKVDETVTIATHTFTRDGYDFIGWNTEKNPTETNPGTTYADGGDYKLTPEDDILYAVWAAKDDELNYNANGGTGTMESSKGKVDQNVTVKANEFERDGYEFAGWNTVADPETESGTAYAAGDDYKLTPGEDKVYAIWKAKDDELVYDANGGTGTMESSKGKVDQNVTVKATNLKETAMNLQAGIQ
ncbi:InlB B-repeat-containing protein [Butyrivibrio sp. INlla16]|uniref:InlB B-repeat-containing protein n=1 Tax=Butyrivibrio sp. INlla16 TaxID=1520807 RepID=UPI00088427F4|nr:InlB B-repeat-containing protein [Butyrivibrio sp. INlla16]SDB66918.1 Listeria/Bacterioides repeat-containing protein [Butyrivibrio sp. INlla16]